MFNYGHNSILFFFYLTFANVLFLLLTSKFYCYFCVYNKKERDLWLKYW